MQIQSLNSGNANYLNLCASSTQPDLSTVRIITAFRPLTRFNLPQILGLIEQKKYFVLRAPRQTGKTSCLLALMEYLNREGEYRALYANLEAAQGARENVGEVMRAILG